MAEAQTQTAQTGAASTSASAVGAKDALDGGSYEVVRRRLLEQVSELSTRAEQLNRARKETFGSSAFELVSTGRVRTDNNALPRDMVSVGKYLLFAFHVVLGLKSQPALSDVFSLYQFDRKDDGTYDLEPVPLAGTFLGSEAFAKDFVDVFRYSKEARVLQLKRTESRLLVVIQIGSDIRDVRVLRFSVSGKGEVAYIDARGEEDYKPPASFSFAWTRAGREQHVAGAHPHVNILDQVFIETIGGDLTIKIENNTKSGKGIHSEPVSDANQTLDDAEFSYAAVGALILLRIKPYREDDTRYFVYNTLTRRVRRIDAIGQACLELPEDQGIIFPGGYYVASGEPKELAPDAGSMRFEGLQRAPNGEDVLYVFYSDIEGAYLQLPYNVISKEVGAPVHCHGYSFFPDGALTVFRSTPGAEPTRVHPFQVWKTPFESAERALSHANTDSYLGKIGNADLVRGISDVYSVRKLAVAESPTKRTFEELVRSIGRAIDDHFWLGKPEAFDLLSTLKELRKTAETVLLEFEKVETLRREAVKALEVAVLAQKDLLRATRPEDTPSATTYLEALGNLRKQRGHVIALREVRYIDLSKLDELEQEVKQRFSDVSLSCIGFFREGTAWRPLEAQLAQLEQDVEATGKVIALGPHRTTLDALSDNLTLLGETVSTLEVDDATIRTEVLEQLSKTLALLNRTRAKLDQKRKELFGKEGRAELAVQLGVFSQAVAAAALACTTPEACDAELGKLFLRLEELTARFGELDDFAEELAKKRDEIEGAFGSRRQTLVDDRHKKSSSLWTTAERMLQGIARKAATLGAEDELLAYFASDPLVQRASDIVGQLEALAENVRAEELASRLKTTKQDAIRKLRDKKDLLDGDTVRLGKHRFSVTAQSVDLVMVEREGALALHLTGTDFYDPIDDPRLLELRDVWSQTLPSETPEVYRSEFLAFEILAESSAKPEAGALLRAARRDGTLLGLVSDAAAKRLDEGYERGVHDADTTAILSELLRVSDTAGALRFAPNARAIALLYFAQLSKEEQAPLSARARSLGRARDVLLQGSALVELGNELSLRAVSFAESAGVSLAVGERADVGPYLVEMLAQKTPKFVVAYDSDAAARAVRQTLEDKGHYADFRQELEVLNGRPLDRLQVARAYAGSHATTADLSALVLEIAAILLTDGIIDRETATADAKCTVTGLLGNHPRLREGTLVFSLAEFLVRVRTFRDHGTLRFCQFRALRSEILDREKQRLRLSEFSPRVLSSFVRNRLIDEVYLALVGNNFAKQLGAAGDQKRTDRMGLLLLVSPPGYGKTTLMEYVASILGLVFVKVNGPALGHDVTSLDPNACTSMTARQEVERINLAFEMGNNVMLYVDDVQHTSAEFLEKFISLCDAQRKVEGVYKGRSRTYDFRGKRFCVVMAANPYTESGARFKIPDMLANRADTHNLGEVLDGKGDLFALSYIENALTSHPALAPLSGRDPKDVHKLVRMAQGENIPTTDLSHGYGASELSELMSLMRLLLQAQKVLLKVNETYILAASQEDAYRTEPPFKLQGSYRNMNKIVQKLASVMTPDELERTIDEHYQSESQTLTTGAEQNLLKLGELRGRLDAAEATRWEQIKEGFRRMNRQGKAGDDPVSRVTATLAGLEEQLLAIRKAIGEASVQSATQASEASARDAASGDTSALAAQIASTVTAAIAELKRLATPNVRVTLANPNPQIIELEAIESFARSVARELGTMRPEGEHTSPELAQKLAELETTLKRVSSTQMKLAADLRTGDATNLYCDTAGSLKGVFIGTYSKPPPLRTQVHVQLVLPGDQSHDVEGFVAFVQDEDGDRPAGFGVVFTRMSAEAKATIMQYARKREPVLYDLEGN